MWIYTKNGFYSIVQDKTDPDYLIVRARVKGDIEALSLRFETIETPDNDYRYRVRISRQTFLRIMDREILQIDYPNFKDSISDKRRSRFYEKVWAITGNMQDDL